MFKKNRRQNVENFSNRNIRPAYVNNASTKNITCYNCNLTGHIARNCPKRRRFNQINWGDNHSQTSFNNSEFVRSNETQSEMSKDFSCINSILITPKNHSDTKNIMRNKIYSRLRRFYSFTFGRFSIRFLVRLTVLIRFFDSDFYDFKFKL